jgi:flagellar M-ring protein FliF
VDKTVPPATVAQLQSAVSAAAGINTGRGDTLTVTQVAFAKNPAGTAAPGSALNPMAYAKYVALGLGLAAFLFFMSRHLKKREEDTLMREPTWLREIEAPTSLKELEQAAAMEFPVQEDSAMRKGLEELAARSPDRVAQQVRVWLNEE